MCKIYSHLLFWGLILFQSDSKTFVDYKTKIDGPLWWLGFEKSTNHQIYSNIKNRKYFTNLFVINFGGLYYFNWIVNRVDIIKQKELDHFHNYPMIEVQMIIKHVKMNISSVQKWTSLICFSSDYHWIIMKVIQFFLLYNLHSIYNLIEVI